MRFVAGTRFVLATSLAPAFAAGVTIWLVYFA
jgi:hypothetical protein